MAYRDEWTNDHGADGLRGKFAVYKRADRHTNYDDDVYWRGERIGEDGEFVFVLRPHSDEAAWAALLRYAELVRYRAPQLAADIEERLADIYGAQHATARIAALRTASLPRPFGFSVDGAGVLPPACCGEGGAHCMRAPSRRPPECWTWVPDSDCRRGGA